METRPDPIGEAFDARSVILIIDVDGIYTADPKLDPNAMLIPGIKGTNRATAADLTDPASGAGPADPITTGGLCRFPATIPVLSTADP
jgi:glutamate 5-kinase